MVTKVSKCLLVVFVLIEAFYADAQGKAAGVYFGPLITNQNALIISNEGKFFTGEVYLDRYQKITVQWVRSLDTLKGVFLFNEKSILIKGLVKGDSLIVDLFGEDGAHQSRGSLKRVTKHINYNVATLFPDLKIEHDIALIGKWLSIKSISREKVFDHPNEYEYHFNDNGTFLIDSPEVTSILKKSNLDMPIYSWSTRAGKVMLKRHSTLSLQEENEGKEYFINGDTLTLRSFKFNAVHLEYLKRKKP